MYPVPVVQVVEALGGPDVLGEGVDTLSNLAGAVARGLPRSVIRQIADRAAPADAQLRNRIAALVASPATVKRSERLSPDASARAERLARVVALAKHVFNDANEARAWLSTPHLMLRRMPIEAAATDLGARQVERLLHNIEYDLPA